jgi:hypothetical protein
LVRHAAITNKHNQVEVNMGPKVRSSMFVILPDYDQNPAFLQKVEDLIKSLTQEGQIKVSRGGNSNEIVIINLETNLTPRYLEVVGKLRASYDRLMNSKQGKVARFETQLEDYEGFIPMGMEECIKLHKLPSLFKPTDRESAEIEAIRAKLDNPNPNPVAQQEATTAQPMGGTQVSGPGMPPPPPVMSQYMIFDNGQQTGPFTIPQLQQMVMQGTFTKQTYVWKNGMANWAFAGTVDELAMLFMTNTPPPPPPIPPMM